MALADTLHRGSINAANVTITGGTITGLTTLGANTANVTQLYADHIGEKTSSHGVVFDNNVDINSGTINGTTIGGTTPAAGTFTTLNTTNKTTETVLLDAATGNEVAHTINYTTNKSTSGNDTGLEINQTDTASPEHRI